MDKDNLGTRDGFDIARRVIDDLRAYYVYYPKYKGAFMLKGDE